MKEFYVIFELLRRRTEALGSWPKSNPSFSYQAVGYLHMGMFTIIAAGAFGHAYNAIDFENLAYDICLALTALLCVLKQIILFSHKKSFSGIFDSLRHPLLRSHEDYLDIYMQQKITICNVIRRAGMFCSIILTLATVLCPLFNISERSLPFTIPFDMKQHPFFIYILIWIIQSFIGATMAVTYHCVDMLVFTLLLIAVGQLEILRAKIIHLTDCFSLQNDRLQNITDYDAYVNILLRECVLQHLAIERYVAFIEETFRLSFLVQLITGIILTCFSGLACILIPVGTLKFVAIFVFFILSLITMSIVCYPGNEIMLQSDNIGHACYMTKWDNCGTSFRKSLLLIMERSKRPLTITAGKFTPMCLATLLAILQSGYSYFTVLWKLDSARKSI